MARGPPHSLSANAALDYDDAKQPFLGRTHHMDESMHAALQQIGKERARMVAVRTAFGEALNAPKRDESFGAFYGACVDYLDFIMARFREQDQASVNLLRPRVPKERVDAHRMIDETQQGLESSQREVTKLAGSLKRFRDEGASGQATFEDAGRAFVHYFATQLSKIKHAIRPISEEYVKPGEFNRSSFITPEAVAREEALFSEVERTVPDGVHLDVKIEEQVWRTDRLKKTS
jgi:hypothetical protein